MGETEIATNNSFIDKWKFTAVMERYIDLQRQKRALDNTNLLNTLLEATIPEIHDSHAFAPSVKVLGIRRMDKGTIGRFHYVTRISMKNNWKLDSRNDGEEDELVEDDIGCGFDEEEIESTLSGAVETLEAHQSSSQVTRLNVERAPVKMFSLRLLEILLSKIGLDDALVSTISYDLNDFCKFHAKLSKILANVDVHPPPFPDPFQIESVEERASTSV